MRSKAPKFQRMQQAGSLWHKRAGVAPPWKYFSSRPMRVLHSVSNSFTGQTALSSVSTAFTPSPSDLIRPGGDVELSCFTVGMQYKNHVNGNNAPTSTESGNEDTLRQWVQSKSYTFKVNLEKKIAVKAFFLSLH